MAASTVPIPTIDATGFHMPVFEDVLAAHEADYKGIYGSDVVLTSDVQDGEWVAIEATALYDTFKVALAVYNAFSPTTAQGTGLSSVVKVNGITRQVASYSTCDVTIVGVAGTALLGSKVRDEAGYSWGLPTSIVIPLSGQIDVTATCLSIGAISAPIGTIDQIATPTRGWQTVTNAGPATPGAPVEQDPQLRVRQSQSTMLPATGVMDGIVGAIEAIPGVERVRGYENDTNAPDANGIPGHSISIVVDGGDAVAIATAIATRKLSAGTYGTATQVITTGVAQIPRTIGFFRPIEPPITYGIALKALSGFTTDTQAQIAQAVSDWTNALGIGAGRGVIRLSRVEAAAELTGTASADTFEILSVTAARDGAVLASSNITIAFNEAPFCQPFYVAFSVTT